MNSTKILEQNVKNSFYFVKDDLKHLEQEQGLLLSRIAFLEREHKALKNLLTRQIPTKFIGNKQTKDLHKEDCMLAQSSSPEAITVFASPLQGRRAGYKDCVCLG